MKIEVPLTGSARESGYQSESVWAEPLGDNKFRIWNLPAFAYNLNMRAVVECALAVGGGLPVAVRVVEQGDVHVVRVFFADSASAEQIRGVLDLLGSRNALFEKYGERLWAVGLRSVVDYEWLGEALQPHVDAGLLGFESGYQPDEPGIGQSA